MEVVDLRTLVPLDVESVLKSVKKTGRVLVAHEAPKFLGYGAEIAAIVAEKAVEYLKGPIVRIAGFDTPFPYTLEDVYMPSSDRILAGVEKLMTY
jgi:pyruvate/2-oxoglutarate/acetoin dehydrogenase E1 component